MKDIISMVKSTEKVSILFKQLWSDILGTRVWPNGDKYSGEFENNLISGEVKFFYLD